ncbi:Amidase [Kribbella flavida DSM 17836]|uniref:Amidase n=1 Tax=Kribbella flavida (strain DSM 17836 / JCM 10339 / NBRC 14399) TaxID=479435 RepID=D2Q528_KRIFD|nr:amidase [Kribbella flavida]ADB36039.1 Amidase [Kribbella flavida DSM 17836]
MTSLEELAAGVRAGRLDPVDLVEKALGRARETSALNAVVHLDADGARAAAARHDRRGPLAGVPVLVKEIIEVEGLPYRCGSAAMDELGRRDADVVRRLRAAGAIVLGLSHSHEFAYGCTGTSNRVGPCRNPHDPERMTGGSSSGAAAAVAAGVVPLAIGTDTAGSVRIPAALCGVAGFKPAYGTLPADGVFPLAQSLDHVGVLTATAADAAYALAALTASAPVAARTTPPRLGVVTSQGEYDAEVSEAWSAALVRLHQAGAATEPVELPDWATTNQIAIDLQGPEAVANHAGRTTTLYQPDVRLRLTEAAEVPAWRYVQARRDTEVVRAQVGKLLAQYDAIVLPTVPLVAPPLSAVADPAASIALRIQLMRNTRLANLTGFPALTVPLPARNLPVGLQVIASDNERAAATALWLTSHLTP